MDTGFWGWYGRIQKKHIKIFVLLAALFYSAYLLNDSVMLQDRLPQTADQLIPILSYLSFGGIVGAVLSIVLAFTSVGRIVDPQFKPASLTGMKARKVMWISIQCGFISAIATAIVLWANLNYDPTLITTLGAGAIVFLACIEWFKGKLQFRVFLLPIVLVTVGSMAVTLTSNPLTNIVESVSSPAFVLAIVAIFLIKNILSAIEKYKGKAGVEKSDGTIFSVLRMVWLAIFGVGGTILYVLYTGRQDELIAYLPNVFSNIGWVLITMFLVFFSGGWEQTAKREMLNVTTVTLFMNLSLIFSPLLTFISAAINHELLNQLPNDPLSWGIRIVGALFAFYGLIHLEAHRTGKSTIEYVRTALVG